MLTRYIKAAMRHATYAPGADGQSYVGEIKEIPGLSSQAATRNGCQMELRAKLETWLRLQLCLQQPIPPMDGIPWVAWTWI